MLIAGGSIVWIGASRPHPPKADPGTHDGGPEAARARGLRGGRPLESCRLGSQDSPHAGAIGEVPIVTIADQFGIDRSTIYRDVDVEPKHPPVRRHNNALVPHRDRSRKIRAPGVTVTTMAKRTSIPACSRAPAGLSRGARIWQANDNAGAPIDASAVKSSFVARVHKVADLGSSARRRQSARSSTWHSRRRSRTRIFQGIAKILVSPSR